LRTIREHLPENLHAAFDRNNRTRLNRYIRSVRNDRPYITDEAAARIGTANYRERIEYRQDAKISKRKSNAVVRTEVNKIQSLLAKGGRLTLRKDSNPYHDESDFFKIVLKQDKSSHTIGRAEIHKRVADRRKDGRNTAYVSSISLGTQGIHKAFERLLGSKRMLELAKNYATVHDKTSELAYGFRVGGARKVGNDYNKGLDLNRVRAKASAIRESKKLRNTHEIARKAWVTRRKNMRIQPV
jgi:hypothetical protein